MNKPCIYNANACICMVSGMGSIAGAFIGYCYTMAMIAI